METLLFFYLQQFFVKSALKTRAKKDIILFILLH